MRRAVLVIAIALGAAAAPAGAQAAAQPCNSANANRAAKEQLLSYADKHSKFYAHFGGIERLRYQRGTLLCRDLTGDSKREMVVQMICCTGGSPSPWGIFVRDAQGAWQLAYARAADTVFRLRASGRRVRAMMPSPYEGACTRFVRFRVVRWDQGRFRSTLTGRQRVTPQC